MYNYGGIITLFRDCTHKNINKAEHKIIHIHYKNVHDLLRFDSFSWNCLGLASSIFKNSLFSTTIGTL